MYVFVRSFVLTALLACCVNAEAGMIVLTADEFPLSNVGYTNQPANAPQFARNVASAFADGGSGNFLVYSSNFGLTESSLQNTMVLAGHSWNINTAIPFTLANLQTYDGVYLGGLPFGYNAAVLTSYVNAGGNVYLMGGTGLFGGATPAGATAEAALWNPFLNAFGLAFTSPYNGLSNNFPIAPTPEPVFAGVTHLFQNFGNPIVDLEPSNPFNRVVDVNGYFAIYDGPDQVAAVPEPASMALLGLTGIGGIGLRWRQRRKAQDVDVAT